MDCKEIPIYITSYNRLSYLEKLVNWLDRHGYHNINILDNNSSYPLLLNYLKKSKHKIYFLDKNYGHLAFWKCGLFDEVIEKGYYVVTDPDILPVENCPDDFMNIFYNLLQHYPQKVKVGFSLKINDLPNCYELKRTVINWEKQFYKKKEKFNGLDCYDAAIDTTFALYAPKVSLDNFFDAIRTSKPYEARHLPWYSDSRNKTEEEIYYSQHATKEFTTWSGTLQKKEVERRYNLSPKVHYIKLFNFLPVYTRKQLFGKTVYSVFGLPVWKIRKMENGFTTKYYFLGIPFLKVTKK